MYSLVLTSDRPERFARTLLPSYEMNTNVSLIPSWSSVNHADSGKGSLGLVREEFMWHHMELEGEDGLIIFNYVPLELRWTFWKGSLLRPPLPHCHSCFFTGGSAFAGHAKVSIKKFITASSALTSCGAGAELCRFRFYWLVKPHIT